MLQGLLETLCTLLVPHIPHCTVQTCPSIAEVTSPGHVWPPGFPLQSFFYCPACHLSFLGYLAHSSLLFCSPARGLLVQSPGSSSVQQAGLAIVLTDFGSRFILFWLHKHFRWRLWSVSSPSVFQLFLMFWYQVFQTHPRQPLLPLQGQPFLQAALSPSQRTELRIPTWAGCSILLRLCHFEANSVEKRKHTGLKTNKMKICGNTTHWYLQLFPCLHVSLRFGPVALLDSASLPAL